MAGNTFTAADVQNRAGSLVAGLWTQLEDIRKFKLWLDDSSHTDMILGPLGVGVPSGDLTIIRSAIADLGGNSGLWAVSHGTYAPAAPSNFFFNAKLLTGLNYAA